MGSLRTPLLTRRNNVQHNILTRLNPRYFLGSIITNTRGSIVSIKSYLDSTQAIYGGHEIR